MRNGILLAENTPQHILAKYNAETLEDAFLQLCHKHGVSDEANQSLQNVTTYNNSNMELEHGSDVEKKEIKRKNSIESNHSDTPCCVGVSDKLEYNKKSLVKRLQLTTKRRMKALLTKNYLQILRQPA